MRRRAVSAWRAASGRTGWMVVLVLIVGYGATLRLAALTDIFGPVEHPRCLRATQQGLADASWLRPASLKWEPTELFPHRDGPPTQYRSDPYTYLLYAREMRSFYAAHRREPLFPGATKVSLWLLGDQDVAVSFTSAAFSTLAIALTFWVGALAFGRAVGLAAAVLVAIEGDLIYWGVGGWRDDAFMCAVLATAIALLRFARAPGPRTGAALGAVVGLACLVRITSLSFAVPGLAMALLLPRLAWRPRVVGAAVAVAISTLLVGPYLLNSWRVYGDPFYAINVHATVYQETEGGLGDQSLTTGSYLREHLRTRPVRTLDTVSRGLTVYPFANKWAGFGAWHAALGSLLSAASAAGLALFAASPVGRLLLVVLASSLLPYAWTWTLIADWRFTMHAYPSFLLAGALAMVSAVASLAWLRRPVLPDLYAVRAPVTWVLVTVLGSLAASYVMSRVLPVHVVREALAAGESHTIMALDRDGPFFGPEWRKGPGDGMPTRVADGWRATLRLPLPPDANYEVTLRVDPWNDPAAPDDDPAPIQIVVNGQLISRCEPGSSAVRFGTCRVSVPARLIKPGSDRVLLATEPGRGRGFRVWYLIVRPADG